MPAATDSGPLRIGLLSYRSNPHCGGQGVYVRNLSYWLSRLGHQVEVISGPPDPQLKDGVKLTHLPCLDLYNPEALFRMPSLRELARPINFMEWFGVSTMGFPEPFTFGLRAYQFMRNRFKDYDIIHDNQSLSYGLWAIGRVVPAVATIHHPITVDREIAIRSVRSKVGKLQQMRWFSFLGMQKRVARSLPRIITVSERAQKDISRDFGVRPDRFSVIPNGINTELFYPIDEIAREPNRIIVTNSADTPLKGLYHLLHAVAKIAAHREVFLTVIGKPKENGGVERLVKKLGIGPLITFTGRISNEEFVRQYARATVAVVPSVYEGFGLPAGEAMACRVPVISTSGGALPEVVGNAGILVPPENPEALAREIVRVFDNPALARELGQKGYERVHRHFTWENAARKTEAVYREVIRGHRGLQQA
ncbi:glycosyltransferase family 4 protein [Desulfosudis oleivorans]|uniref:Glycosyl transferase group 1 n=1 Tax=Desulfosudis oleivorans (strain DSM 6200 / JCM 39069 / Hxd3) TaxID=96561 RepID=A8ZWR6_DESOH|nr:glycosyltransferase family 4 protein [Desulfosudis oleivorans]ABW68397.1 glycosyl transferase group 1 [Desulfosudis oleivorans Hxd3]